MNNIKTTQVVKEYFRTMVQVNNHPRDGILFYSARHTECGTNLVLFTGPEGIIPSEEDLQQLRQTREWLMPADLEGWIQCSVSKEFHSDQGGEYRLGQASVGMWQRVRAWAHMVSRWTNRARDNRRTIT